MVTLEDYLERIGYRGTLAPTQSTLNQLHLAHMLTVPFENLDISLGRRINLDLPSILHKIVHLRRGGFCYELNSAFAWLLSEIGFTVEMLSAATYDGKTLGPEFDHLLLRVDIAHSLFADVGFGDSFLKPIGLADNPVHQFDRFYRLEHSGSRYTLEQRFESGDWKHLYIFRLVPRQLSDFDAMCQFHQTNSASNFTRKTVCSRATEQGRVTCTNSRLVVTEAGQRREVIIDNPELLGDTLHQHFGIDLTSSELQQLQAVTQSQDQH